MERVINYNQVERSIKNKSSITDEDFKKMMPFFCVKKVRKNSEIISIGDISRELFFINFGSLFTYSVDDLGKEHILKFAFENEWLGTPESFLSDCPSEYGIAANEDSELLSISFERRESLIKVVPMMEQFFKEVSDAYLLNIINLYRSRVSDLAATRYELLFHDKPELFQRVPLHAIASFLGITPESLSRIRNSRLHKQKLTLLKGRVTKC